MNLKATVEDGWMQGETSGILVTVYDQDEPDRAMSMEAVGTWEEVPSAIDRLKADWMENPPERRQLATAESRWILKPELTAGNEKLFVVSMLVGDKLSGALARGTKAEAVYGLAVSTLLTNYPAATIRVEVSQAHLSTIADLK